MAPSATSSSSDVPCTLPLESGDTPSCVSDFSSDKIRKLMPKTSEIYVFNIITIDPKLFEAFTIQTRFLKLFASFKARIPEQSKHCIPRYLQSHFCKTNGQIPAKFCEKNSQLSRQISGKRPSVINQMLGRKIMCRISYLLPPSLGAKFSFVWLATLLYGTKCCHRGNKEEPTLTLKLYQKMFRCFEKYIVIFNR